MEKDVMSTHRVWHKFYGWMIKTFGKDLYGKWQYMKGTGADGKKFNFKYRDYNEYELSKRLVGYEVMCKIEKYVNRSCPEIKIIRCDDSVYAGSFILLIPHPKMGITMMFIPQCTYIGNQMFLYNNHYKMFTKALREMKSTYDGAL